MKKASVKTAAIVFATILLAAVSPVVQGQDIQPFKAEEVKPYQGQEVQPVKAKEIKPSKTKKENPYRVVKINPRVAEEKKEKPAAGVISDDFIGLFQYWVPGTSYTVPDYTNQQLVIHNSAGSGVLPGGIKINADGTYIWNSSWDEKVIKGNWRATTDQDYPLELIQAQEGKDWKVGKTAGDPSTITLWNGSIWYTGKKIRK